MPTEQEIQKLGEELARATSKLNVFTDPFKGLAVPNIKLPEIRVNPLPDIAEANLASEFYKRLTKWISDFDAALDEKSEVGVRLVNFGQSMVFHLTGMRYWNPSLIGFTGITDDGNPVELIQNVSQISILLMKLPRRDPSEPKQPIGFCKETSTDEISSPPEESSGI